MSIPSRLPRLSSAAWGAIALAALSAALGYFGAPWPVWLGVLGIGLLAGGMAVREHGRATRADRFGEPVEPPAKPPPMFGIRQLGTGTFRRNRGRMLDADSVDTLIAEDNDGEEKQHEDSAAGKQEG